MRSPNLLIMKKIFLQTHMIVCITLILLLDRYKDWRVLIIRPIMTLINVPVQTLIFLGISVWPCSKSMIIFLAPMPAVLEIHIAVQKETTRHWSKYFEKRLKLQWWSLTLCNRTVSFCRNRLYTVAANFHSVQVKFM